MDEQMTTVRIDGLRYVYGVDVDVALANRDAEIAAFRQQVDAWQATGNAIMLCAVGREAPLSDSDVCGEINALRHQVAELQATVKKLQAEIHAADIRGVLDWTS